MREENVISYSQLDCKPELLRPHHSLLLTASPNPGVSTMVSFSFTPFSSMSTVCFVISTVWLIRSAGHKHRAGLQPLIGSAGVWIDCRLTFRVEQFSIFMQIGQEQAVYQRGFTQTGFSWNTNASQNQHFKITNIWLTRRLKKRQKLHLDWLKPKHPDCPLVVSCSKALLMLEKNMSN